MDIITLVRSAVCGLLAVADTRLAAALRVVITSGDDYARAAKPQIDGDDETACKQLIDSRARDGMAVLDGLELDERVGKAAQLVATVLGQDIVDDGDGMFWIARRSPPIGDFHCRSRDPRHGHKTQSRGFYVYKGHIAVDPDSEIITATTVTPGNISDADAAEYLLADMLPTEADGATVFCDAAYSTSRCTPRWIPSRGRGIVETVGRQ